jgi:hypothetical protein
MQASCCVDAHPVRVKGTYFLTGFARGGRLMGGEDMSAATASRPAAPDAGLQLDSLEACQRPLQTWLHKLPHRCSA